MSSFLCFICHSTVNSDTNEDIRERYREVIGMNLCPDAHLCHICCHVLNKLWLFKSVCLKRSLEYPVLFSEKGTLNLQKNDIEIYVLCFEEQCEQYQNRNINHKSYNFCYDHHNNFDDHQQCDESNQYVELEDDRNVFEDYGKPEEHVTVNQQAIFESNAEIEDLGVKTENESIINQEDSTENDDLSNLSSDNQTKVEQGEVDKDVTLDSETDFNQNAEINNDIFEYKSPDISKFGINDENYEFDNEINNLTDSDKKIYDKVKKNKTKSKRIKKRAYEVITLSLKEQKAELEARRKEKKYIDAEFKCHHCASGFLFKDTYQTHMMRHEESNGEYRCPICTLRFASLSVLRVHRGVHAERYRCTRCDVILRTRSKRTHARVCHGKRGDAAACHLCGNTFQDSSGLHQHLKRFHMTKTSSRIYSCNTCGKTYNNQAAVRTHMIKHINRKFNCDTCEATFSSPYTLNQHKKKHIEGSGEKGQHYCVTCDVGFDSKKSLLAHQRYTLRHQLTLYECPICNRVCPNNRSLSSHIETVHSGSKNHACPHCPATYTSRKSLVRHVRAHIQKPEPKVAMCQLCGKSFKGNNKLNRHLKEVCKKAKLEEQLASLYEHELNDIP